MESLFEQLKDYGRSGIYPCHMPGHKRHGLGVLPKPLAELDITEVEGFDNLHQPEGILQELQRYAAAAYGAEETYYLVGGSTCGILSAVSAAVPRGGRLLIARNCHKSIYHAAYLRQLQLSYLCPGQLPEVDICEAITARQVQEALESEQGIQGVLIVSPTYEGRIAEVEEIARIVHGYGIPLIVDEAHGAHLGFHPGFAQGSSRAGADLVVTSVHKTLPAMTQTALLHVNGQLVDRRLLRRFLRIYQSSSPSYVLMASIDNAVHLAREEGRQLLQRMTENWSRMLRKLSDCRTLSIWPPATLAQAEYQKHQDMGKLIISVKNAEMTGQELYRELLEKFGLQMEMACDNYVLAMFTIGDEAQGYERLTEALLEIDNRMQKTKARETRLAEDRAIAQTEARGTRLAKDRVIAQTETGGTKLVEDRGIAQTEDRRIKPAESTAISQAEASGTRRTGSVWKAVQTCPQHRDRKALSECWDQPVEWIALKDAVGRYAGEFVNIYPPGTPILVPGERLEEADRQLIGQYLKDGLRVQGITIQDGEPGLAVLTETAMG